MKVADLFVHLGFVVGETKEAEAAVKLSKEFVAQNNAVAKSNVARAQSVKHKASDEERAAKATAKQEARAAKEAEKAKVQAERALLRGEDEKAAAKAEEAAQEARRQKQAAKEAEKASRAEAKGLEAKAKKEEKDEKDNFNRQMAWDRALMREEDERAAAKAKEADEELARQKQSEAALKSTGNAATKAAATFAAMAAAITVVARMSALAAERIANFSASTGIKGDTLQAASFQGAQAGVSPEDMAEQLKSLQLQATKIRFGQATMPVGWGYLGMDPTKTADENLKTAAATVKKSKNVDEARLWALQSGFSEDQFTMMRRGGFNEMPQHLRISEDQAKEGQEAARAWREVVATLKAATVRFMAEFYKPMALLAKIILPVVRGFTWLLEAFLAVPGFGTLLKAGLIALVAVISGLAVALTGLAFAIKMASIAIELQAGATALGKGAVGGGLIAASLTKLKSLWGWIIAGATAIWGWIVVGWEAVSGAVLILGDVIAGLAAALSGVAEIAAIIAAVIAAVSGIVYLGFKALDWFNKPGEEAEDTRIAVPSDSDKRWTNSLPVGNASSQVTNNITNSPSVTITAPEGADSRQLGGLAKREVMDALEDHTQKVFDFAARQMFNPYESAARP